MSTLRVNSIQEADGTAFVFGKIAQIVNATTQTEVSTTSTTHADTGLTLSITPTSASNKILVFVSQPYRLRNTSGNTCGCDIRLIRGGTTLVQGPGNYAIWHQNGSGNVDIFDRINYHYLDSPSTTSATTYKTTAAVYSSSHQLWTQPYATALASGTSYLTAMEVVA